jgi:hypothetical protein
MRKLVLIFGPIEVSIPILLALAATLKAGPGGDLAFIVGENRRPLTEGASATYSAGPQDRWCAAPHRVCGAVESLTLARPTSLAKSANERVRRSTL